MKPDEAEPNTAESAPAPAVPERGWLAGGVVVGALLGGTALAWAFSRWRETPVEARTRERLAPRSSPSVVPSAADIHVR